MWGWEQHSTALAPRTETDGQRCQIMCPSTAYVLFLGEESGAEIYLHGEESDKGRLVIWIDR